MTKARLRRRMLRLRRALPSDEAKRRSKEVLSHLLSHPVYKNSRTVHTYISLDDEVDTWPLISRALDDGKRVVVPVVSGDDMVHCEVDSSSEFVRGRFGLWEPKHRREVDVEELDLVIVPGVAFDRRGYRLGFGRGYYDRFLSQVSAPKVGLAFDFQVVPRIPEDPHDQRLDYLVTEEGIFRIFKEKVEKLDYQPKFGDICH